MKFVISVLAIGFVCAMTVPAQAQEAELVNEIVARVNNDIVTRVDYLNALRDFKEELTRQLQQAGKSDAEINAEFERQKPTVLNYIIEDLLLEQKAKELNIDVEAEVNQQMAEIAKENGQPSVLAFENELKKQGLDPETARGTLRRRLQQQYVIQREVLQPIYQRLSEKEKREFYDKHKDGFTTPGEVTISGFADNLRFRLVDFGHLKESKLPCRIVHKFRRDPMLANLQLQVDALVNRRGH